MSDNVEYLPIWKANATAEERFLEMAAIARKHPDRFDKVLIIWNYSKPDDDNVMKTEYVTHGCDTTNLYGLIELAKLEIADWTRRGR